MCFNIEVKICPEGHCMAGDTMKLSRIFIVFVFAVMAVCAAAAGFYFSFQNMNAEPVLVERPEAAEQRVVALMEAVCDSDYDTVSALLFGNPQLGVERVAADDVGVLFWDALEESRTYELTSECYATDTGLAWDVKMECLDLGSVTANLRQRAQSLLEERVAEAEDTSEVYDENNEYREEFVMDVLYDAAQGALAEDAETVTYEFTLNLIYTNGAWWIMPEDPLMEAVSGGILN